MARQRPVENGKTLIYKGPTRSQAIVGPVSGNGYPTHNKPQPVERQDVEALLTTGLWSKPPRKKRVMEVQNASE